MMSPAVSLDLLHSLDQLFEAELVAFGCFALGPKFELLQSKDEGTVRKSIAWLPPLKSRKSVGRVGSAEALSSRCETVTSYVTGFEDFIDGCVSGFKYCI